MCVCVCVCIENTYILNADSSNSIARIHVYIYVCIIHDYDIFIASQHVVLRLGNKTMALLQSHPNEALALLQCHPNQKGPLTAPILMALLQRQYSWHSYSTKTDGTQCQFSPASLALLQCQPSLLALLHCQGFPRLLQLVQGKSCLTGSCKIRCDMWLVNETADI